MRSNRRTILRLVAGIAAFFLVALSGPVARWNATAAPAEPAIAFDRDGHAQIPFDLRNQHLWIRGRVNGSDSLWIVVDTGASASLLDEGVARSLGLRLTGRQRSRGSGGEQIGHQVKNVTIALPGVTLHKPLLGTLDLSKIGMTGARPMQLILGYELFESCVVRFDYPARVIDVWDAAHAPRDLAGASVPMTLIENHPYVEAEVGIPGRAPLRGRFLIDSGSSGALLIAPEVTARENLLTAFPRTLTSFGRGVGGEGRSQVGRADSLSLGGLTFSRPLVAMPEPSAGRISALGSIGNIGGQILRRCRVTFDYSNKRIHLEPATDFARPFEADMSGAALTRGPDGTVVRWVSPSSPAAEAGLQVGDVVTHVDGVPTETIDPAALRLRFQEEARVVRLSLKRGSESSEVTLTLRRLI